MKHLIKIGSLTVLCALTLGCASLSEWLNSDDSDIPVGNPKPEDARNDPDARIKD